MGRKLLSSLLVLLMLVLMVPIPSFAADETVISTTIAGITIPVKGVAPVTTVSGTGYTGTVAWSNSPETFAANTIYTATITLTPADGYTLTGVTKNYFEVPGATATNIAGSGVVIAVFPATASETVPVILPVPTTIAGITIPVKGVAPVTTVSGTGYTGTVAWSDSPETFAANTVYTATITLTPSAGYTLTGVTENYFKVPGATATNIAGSGVVTAVFPATASETVPVILPVPTTIAGITIPVKGVAPVTTVSAIEYTATIAWSDSPETFAANTVYTATITLTPAAGYTLTGVTENYFKVPGATATNIAGSGVVTAVFPATGAVIPPVLVSATTDSTGGTVTMTFNKVMANPSADVGSFTVKIKGIMYDYDNEVADIPVTATVALSSAALSLDPTKIDLTLDTPLQRGDIVTVDYTPGTVRAADTGILEVFVSQPVTNAIPVIINTNLVGTWQIYDHVGNWGEDSYPSPNANDPRGSEFNRHIIINGSSIYFYGNGIEPFKDFLYLPSDQDAAKSFTFNLDLSGIKFHSMEGGGFLFNTIIKENLISGYCVLFQKKVNYVNDEDVTVYEANLYQIDGVNLNDFHDGLGNYYNLGSGGEGITNLGTFSLETGDNHLINLEASSKTVDMRDGTTKLIDNFTLPKEYSYGVGIIGSYQSHWCNELSYFVFSNLNIQGIADLSAVLAGNQANLTFTAPEGSEAVSVEQSTDGGVTWVPANASPINDTSTTATVTGLVINNTYNFRLHIMGGKYNGYSRVGTVDYRGEAVIIPTPVSSSVSRTQYILTINKIGEGVVLPGIGDYGYDSATIVMLTATPAEGYTFEGWTGTTGSSVYMDQKKTITAVFKPIVAETTPEIDTPIPPETNEVEEPSPDVADTLPKTGGIPAIVICGFGGLITTVGLYLRRKK